MSSIQEPTNLGLSERAHSKLKALAIEKDGHFGQMADAYRFAIALALSSGVLPDEISGRQNVFGVATIDPERDLYNAIRTLIDTGEIPVYRWAERLADWGVMEMARLADEGKLDIGLLIREAEARSAV